jgi:3',5'-cyclic AMP phosphodiesterase CpdA
MPAPLRFREDGTFTIVQFTDMHWHNGEPEDQRTRALLARTLDAEEPDLVALTGDVIAGNGCDDPAKSYRDAVAPIEERGIPWAATFGNHDDEGSVDRDGLMEVQMSCAHSLSQPGPEEVSGVGNYALSVQSNDGDISAAVLYFIDTNSYAETDIGGYGWVRRDQIAWWLDTARAQHTNAVEDAPALAFFHIPLPEYDEVWDLHPCHGVKHEAVCPPRINTGLFAAFHEFGDVVGTFVGHDHVNDYVGELHGIRLCYGRGSGFSTYGRDSFPRGARVIRLTQGKREFETWMRLEDDVKVTEQLLHEPCGRTLTA